MKFKLYRNYGALNSPPVFDAFEHGIRNLGHEVVQDNEDVSVIWSVLWQGRMAGNHQIYQSAKKQRKQVIIIEVGNFKRGISWRICHQHINRLGNFGNNDDLDPNRPSKLGINLQPFRENRRDDILIACQHPKSLQWEGMPSMSQWIRETINRIRQYSDRKIVVRPHPRSPINEKFEGATIDIPQKVSNTYDDFNISYNFHCVINHNSGPAVQAAINGTPIICDTTSLAFPVSDSWENLEKLYLPDRTEWILKLSHTEWTVDEISQGIPLLRILKTFS